MIRSSSGYEIEPLSTARRDALADDLTAEEREVILNHGTENPYCGTLLNNKSTGIYACRLCGLPLFRSNEKFDSGTGWPSFTTPFDDQHVREVEDLSLGMARVEVRCARCDGHLGHVFTDGPQPAGRRYCLNSIALQFFAEGSEIQQRTEHPSVSFGSGETKIRSAGPDAMRDGAATPWSVVDESSDESFPASDPPAW